MDQKQPRTGAPARYPAHHRPPVRRPDPTLRTDLQAAIDASNELGPEYEGAVVESFLDRLEDTIDARVEAKLAERSGNAPATRQGIDGSRLALAIVTTGLGIPLTGIATQIHPQLLAFVIVWIGIVTINLVAAVNRKS